MTCAEIERDLVGYHFNELEDDVRKRIEDHLCDCKACVRAYVEIKRGIETGGERPSDLARAKLRRAVARELGVERTWSWWERPLAIAVAASVVLLAGVTTRALTSLPADPPHALQR